MPSISDVLRILSDEKGFVIFKSVSNGDENRSEMIRTKFKLSRKQYYTRMANLTRAGLIGKDKARYSVTSFGRVVQHSLSLTETAIDNYWKLKAVDALEMSDEFQDEEYQKIINALIDNEQLKAQLSKSHAALCKDLQARSSSSYQSPSLSEIYT